MRASVTNLLLATNASRLIVYKESIERETFGHLQIHGRYKELCPVVGPQVTQGQGGSGVGERAEERRV